MVKHIIIIGNGMVSYKFCEKFKAQSSSSEYKITVIGEELFPAYDRVHLSEYFSDQSVDNLTLAKPNWYKENNIKLLTNTLAIKINASSKSVITSNGDDIAYDVLVLATGSRPFIPSIEGVNKKGVFVYRTIDDLDAIIKYGKENRMSGKMKATVLGGGLLGLEAAKAVIDLGLQADVVEFASHLMPRQLDEAGGEMLKEIIEALGIKIHCQKQTTHIEGNEYIEALRFKDDTILETDMLVISAGIRARQELAESCEIELGPKGGFKVDSAMKTNLPDVYAIGEAASYQGMTYGLVAPGYDMADVAVNQILGIDKLMDEQIDMSTKLKLIGTDVASFGEPFDTSEPSEKIVYENKRAGIYKRVNISEDGKKLLGGILVGDAEDYNMLFQIYKNGLALPEHPVDLIIKPSDGSASVGSVTDLPDEAIICSCESVSKGSICHAVMEEGCEDMKALVACTKATSGCGGCKPMVKDLQNAILSQMGKEVKEIICEHFKYNRRELYDMIKVKGIKTYNEALDQVGQGHGCETCKPALASIFAGIYNETPIKQETIQDTNDRFLANIQRNGTYSVVPRVPGGEITADKLIALGEVAKKYDLYSKITGGQRIDLFGARVDQLPLIWKDLIDAGFESGHAYGKALRTVKSCVGSTWCRYGMDESVSFAIELENRYRGIRSPHKLKGGVSGCIRECAEARCKDFGLIATEEGWNLYVCGNGGANPKHAKLLAESIDNESVVKYLDRFLMFYIKTAPPLTRTAKWLEQLDGGMTYLKQVVVEDSLGIAKELELQMQALVNSFECEWKQVVESEELQKRYKHFVNSDEADDNITFVKMREQKMPKPWN